jgi:hypothetical protein
MENNKKDIIAPWFMVLSFIISLLSASLIYFNH